MAALGHSTLCWSRFASCSHGPVHPTPCSIPHDAALVDITGLSDNASVSTAPRSSGCALACRTRLLSRRSVSEMASGGRGPLFNLVRGRHGTSWTTAPDPHRFTLCSRRLVPTLFSP
eukprot:scaffold70981_cov32-Tisochrysis_lutea.AAC.2